MKIKFAMFAATGALALGGLMLAQDASTGSGSGSGAGSGSGKMSSGKMGMGNMGADSHFVAEAASGGLAEVELGKMAQQKASSDKVKQFGQRMVTDHSKANDQLKQVAQQENLTLPTTMNAKDQATVTRLSALSGAEFDKAYMKDMLADHKKDVANFQKEANSGKDPGVKNFASQTLPVLQEHLKMVEDLHSKM